jgi:hypothetical protein
LYQDGAFSVDLNFTDGQTHRTALYFVDWDQSGRAQTVEILDASTGAVLNTQTVTGFGSGKYLVWDLKGNVRVRLTKIAGFNAVLSGLFFGPATTSGGTVQQTTTATFAQSKVSVRIAGAPGQSFKIYSSSNLSSWTEITTVILNSSTYDYTDPAVGNGPKFYKAVPQ